MWTSEHHYGIVAGAVASSYRIMQPLHSHPNHLISHPYERSPVFLLALLSPLPLRDLGILSCFLCILPEGAGQRTCLGPTILEFLSHPSPLPTSVSAWCFSGSLHAEPGEASNEDPVHRLDPGT